MYCIYPTVCLAAACTLDALPWALAHLAPPGQKLDMKRAGSRATKLVLAAVLVLSVSRTVALFEYYRAPMEVFKAFRGREPSVEALLRHNGLVATEVA